MDIDGYCTDMGIIYNIHFIHKNHIIVLLKITFNIQYPTIMVYYGYYGYNMILIMDIIDYGLWLWLWLLWITDDWYYDKKDHIVEKWNDNRGMVISMMIWWLA